MQVQTLNPSHLPSQQPPESPAASLLTSPQPTPSPHEFITSGSWEVGPLQSSWRCSPVPQATTTGGLLETSLQFLLLRLLLSLLSTLVVDSLVNISASSLLRCWRLSCADDLKQVQMYLCCPVLIFFIWLQSNVFVIFVISWWKREELFFLLILSPRHSRGTSCNCIECSIIFLFRSCAYLTFTPFFMYNVCMTSKLDEHATDEL
jgi:hypothetical protein